MIDPRCPLCVDAGGAVVFQCPKFRVIRADEVGFPAFYRVVWTEHVSEFSDLDAASRSLCMAAVAAVELALREHLRPTKINLAALGNVVPHLHWHVIARFDWDSHYPAPVWAGAKRVGDGAALKAIRVRLDEVDRAIRCALTAVCHTAGGEQILNRMISDDKV